MRRFVLALDHAWDAAFGGDANPLKQLGAIAFVLLALLAASGVVLYALLETSAQGAYRSIEALSRTPGSPGSLLRGLHRYAADAFVLVIVLHLAREWALGHYARFRRYAWLTGVVLLPLAYASASCGFWMHWDRLGQFSAIATAEWIDALPFLGAPLARNFLQGGVGDRLFSLFVFVHLGLPLLLVFGGWAHVQRLARPRVFPPPHVIAGTVAALLLLALVLPVRSQGAAELGTAPQALSFDWLLLFVHPLAQAGSPQFAWALVALCLLVLFALPFVRPGAAPLLAEVQPAHCNGCGRCVEDCPYAAIVLVPHPGGRARARMAQVDPDLCAGCGICAGACPSSTPFRKATAFITGIDLPRPSVEQLRFALHRGLAQGRRQVVFGCDHAARVDSLQDPGVLALSLPCSAMLPPSFVEYALRRGAERVLVAGCRPGSCEFRLGQRWLQERLQGAREPHLRAGVPATAWGTVWADRGEESRLRAALEERA